MNNSYNNPSMNGFGQNDYNNPDDPNLANIDPTKQEFSQYSNDNMSQNYSVGMDNNVDPTVNEFTQLDNNPMPQNKLDNGLSEINQFYQAPKPTNEYSSPIPGVDPFGRDASMPNNTDPTVNEFSQYTTPDFNASSTMNPNMGYTEPAQNNYGQNMGYNEPVQNNFGQNMGYNGPEQNMGYNNFNQPNGMNQNVGYTEPVQNNFGQNMGYSDPNQGMMNQDMGYNPSMQQGFNSNMNFNQPNGMNQGASLPPMNQPQMMNNQEMPNYQNYQSNPEPQDNKKNNKILIIIIGVLVAIVVGLVSYFVVSSIINNSKNPEKEYQKKLVEQEKESETLTKNLEYVDTKLKDGNILLELKNKNSKMVYASGKAEFYDANNQLVNAEDIFAVIGPNEKVYDLIFITNEAANYDTYKISIKLSPETQVDDQKKNVTYETYKSDTYVTVQYKNGSSKKLEIINAVIMYYDKEGNIVGCNSASAFDVDPNATASAKVYQPIDLSYNVVPFEKYEVIINSAYSTKK